MLTNYNNKNSYTRPQQVVWIYKVQTVPEDTDAKMKLAGISLKYLLGVMSLAID